jgi:hypothetical protein
MMNLENQITLNQDQEYAYKTLEDLKSNPRHDKNKDEAKAHEDLKRIL